MGDCEGCLGELGACILRSEIRLEENRLASVAGDDLSDAFRRGPVLMVVQEDASTLTRKPDRDCSADPAARAGNQRSSAVEPETRTGRCAHGVDLKWITCTPLPVQS